LEIIEGNLWTLTGDIISNNNSGDISLSGFVDMKSGDHEFSFKTPGGDTGISFNASELGNRSAFNMRNSSISTLADRYFYIGYGGNLALSVRYNNFIGINKSLPEYRLDVYNGICQIDTCWIGRLTNNDSDYAVFGHSSLTNDEYGVALWQNITGFTCIQAEQTLLFRINNNPKMILDSTGRFGINTTSPTATLHVNGDARIDGDIDLLYGHITLSKKKNYIGELFNSSNGWKRC
jgi:hypothetical protein